MQPNQIQTQQDMTPEDAKASLGFSTHLVEQMLMQQAQAQGAVPMEDTSQTFQNDPQQSQESQNIDTELKDMEERLTQKIEDIDVSSELESIKKELNLLQNDDNNDNTE